MKDLPDITETGSWIIDENCSFYYHWSVNLANWVVKYLNDYKNEPFYDFGCGCGKYLSYFKDAGFSDLTGFEANFSESKKEFNNIINQDLTKPFTVNKKGSCLFTEVAEHIPNKYIDIVLDNVVGACNNKLIMSWAPPSQLGHGHINCIDANKAITKIVNRGMIYLDDDTDMVRNAILSNEICSWLKNSLLIFGKI